MNTVEGITAGALVDGGLVEVAYEVDQPAELIELGKAMDSVAMEKRGICLVTGVSTTL
jgi:2-keto-3-deoxy-galactonokinase